MVRWENMRTWHASPHHLTRRVTTRVDLEANRLRTRDPALASAYAQYKAIHRKYDPSFYAGCLMLPPAKRP